MIQSVSLLISIFILPKTNKKFIKLLRFSILTQLLSSLYILIINELIDARIISINNPKLIGILYNIPITIFEIIACSLFIYSLILLRKYITKDE